MRERMGFTILEILIAISILLVGIVGVISLFPVAIKVGGEAISDSLSVNLARSVEEAFRAAMKHRRVSFAPAGEREHVLGYFIYDHDGVYDPQSTVQKLSKDPVPGDPNDVRRAARWDLDCVILLPCDNSDRADAGAGYAGSTTAEARSRAYLAGKVFVYPEGDPGESRNALPANGRGDPSQADDDKDDFELDHSREEVVRIRRGELVPGEEWPLRVTKTFRFGPKVLAHAEEKPKPGEGDDPYRQYSYALAIRRAYEDGSISLSARRFSPANDLFEVKVLVFRAFMPESRQGYPIFTTTFLVSR